MIHIRSNPSGLHLTTCFNRRVKTHRTSDLLYTTKLTWWLSQICLNCSSDLEILQNLENWKVTILHICFFFGFSISKTFCLFPKKKKKKSQISIMVSNLYTPLYVKKECWALFCILSGAVLMAWMTSALSACRSTARVTHSSWHSHLVWLRCHCRAVSDMGSAKSESCMIRLSALRTIGFYMWVKRDVRCEEYEKRLESMLLSSLILVKDIRIEQLCVPLSQVLYRLQGSVLRLGVRRHVPGNHKHKVCYS